MNTDTGRIYEALGEDALTAMASLTDRAKDALAELEEGDPRARLIGNRIVGRALSDDEVVALRDAARGQSIVEVSPTVAHTMKLGQRELDRRKKRRKVAKASRKTNR